MSTLDIHGDMVRGNIETAVLKCLSEGDKYGFEICKDIEERTRGQYTLKQPTLYSCLARLEAQGLVQFYWQDNNDKGAKRKYYRLTEQGREFFIQKQTQWEYSRTVIDKMISDQEFDLESLAKKDDASDSEIGTDDSNDSDISTDDSNDSEINEVAEQERHDSTDSDKNIEFAEEIEESLADETEDDEPFVEEEDDTLSFEEEEEDDESFIEDEDDSVFQFSEEDIDEHLSIESDSDELENMTTEKEKTPTFEEIFAEYTDLVRTNSYSESIANQSYMPKQKPSQEEIFDEVFYNQKSNPNNASSDDSFDMFSTIEETREAWSRKIESMEAADKANDTQRHVENDKSFQKEKPEIMKKENEDSEGDKIIYNNRKTQTQSDNEPSSYVFYNSKRSADNANEGRPKTERETVERVSFKTDPKEYISTVRNTSTTSSKDYRTVLSKIAGINTKNQTHSRANSDSRTGSAKSFERTSNAGRSYSESGTSFSERTEGYERFEQSLLDNENTIVRSHSKTTTKTYNDIFYVYGNKIRLFQYAILGIIILLQTLAVYLALVTRLKLTGDLWLYPTAVAFAIAFSLLGVVLYVYNPKQIRRVDSTGKIFLTRLLITVFSILLVLVLNILAEKTLFASIDYLSRLILPSILCLNIIIADIVFILLYRSKRFSAYS